MLTLSSITRMVFVQFGAHALGTPVFQTPFTRALHTQNNLMQTRIDYMATVRTRKAPWTFCLGAEVLAKDTEGVEFLATFEVAEMMVYNDQTVYTGYYVRRGVDRVLIFVSIRRLQSLQGCPERKKNNSSGQHSMLLFLGAFILVWYIPPYIHVSIAFVYEMYFYNMAARRVRKAPRVFCPEAQVFAKDARGTLFLATFELAETMSPCLHSMSETNISLD
ncbi:hypothetical protein BDN70DRAFT_901275 [Pholiota conissans]|uniref:Uncharacterized protein n=1 Tax=Pholiota conissans TaxID=109636 RepID=A0A9P5YMA5_9AGAR|nr:hypothetical protein BDN70DRAFT_901275 [Pholiota conissans]